MELSPMTILIGLVPVLGIGAGYLFLGPLKDMFKGWSKSRAHKDAIKTGEAKVKVIATKSTEVVARVKNIEKAQANTRQAIKLEVAASKKRIDAIVESDKNLSELADDFDSNW